MNRATNILSITLVSLSTTIFAPSTSEAAFKCWVNDEGIKECGNAVPAKYSKKEIQTVDERGVVRAVRPRERTAEELEIERQKAEEEAKKAEAKKKQDAQDRVLLQTYLNIDDLLLSLDWKVSTLQSRITIAENQLSSMQSKFDSQVARAAIFERKGKPVPERVTGQLEELRTQIRNTTDQVAAQQKEIDEIKKTFAHDVERFQIKSLEGKLYNIEELGRARILNSSVKSCDSKEQCQTLFESAKKYALKKSSTGVQFDTNYTMVTSSPVKEDQIATSVTYIERREFPYKIVLQARCHPSDAGEKLCASDKISWLLAEYKMLR